MPDPFERLAFFQRNKSDRDTERTVAKLENYAQGEGDEKSYIKDMGEIAYLLRTRDLEAEMLAEVLPFVEAKKDLGKVGKAVKYMRETSKKDAYSAANIQKIVQDTANLTAKKTIQEFVTMMKSAESRKNEKPKEEKPKEGPKKEKPKKNKQK